MNVPALRIAALVAFAASCAIVPPPLAFALAGVAAIINLFVADAGRALGALLWRSRWLLAMVVLVNAFATPGPPAWAAAPDWAPSAAGLALAQHRGGSLLAMLAAVNLLLRSTPTPALVDGLSALAQPFRPLGLDPERLATRVAGALAELGGTERALRARADGGSWLDAMAERIIAIESRAER